MTEDSSRAAPDYTCRDVLPPLPPGSLPDGVIAVIRSRDRYLLTRRGPGVPAAGWWCFPGGGLEPGETEEQALVREIEEELGVRVEPRERLWRATTAWGVDLSWWSVAGAPDPSVPLRLEAAEIAEVRWLTREEAVGLELLLGSNHAFFERVSPSDPTSCDPEGDRGAR